MDTYIITFVNVETGEPVAHMEIQAIDYDTAQTLADDMNSSYTAYAGLKEE